MGEAEGDWLATAHGYLPLAALAEVATKDQDPAELAEQMIGTPYLWGGRTAKGIDCSGLVQLVWGPAGVQLPRDRDLQLAARGADKDVDTPALARGDIIFFPGTVGLMAESTHLIHSIRPDMA